MPYIVTGACETPHSVEFAAPPVTPKKKIKKERKVTLCDV